MKLSYDKKIHMPHETFRKGDKILIYQPNNHSYKNEPKHSHVWRRDWLGPFEVLGLRYPTNPDVYLTIAGTREIVSIC